MKLNKKGFEISFSWLFAVIAGISVFLFLTWFAVKQTDLFGNVSAQAAAEELDIAFTSFSSSMIGTKLNFPKDVELEFKCDSNEERMLINGKGGKKLKGNIVFSPNNMKNNEFSLWTKGWNIPFRVSNFIFLADNKHRYNLDGISSTELEGVPDIFKTGVDGEKINFVQGRDGSPSDDEKTIYLEYDSELDEHYGTIYIKGNEGQPLSYFGDAMIYAAIFSDKDNFDCLYNKAKERAENVIKVYEERAKEMRGGCSLGFSFDIFDFSYEKIKELKESNDGLLNLGCEGLY